MRRMLKAKIHRVTVTDANLLYEGSLTLDVELLEAANLVVHEKIEVVNVNTGDRFSTYLIAGEKGQCCLNGAAARLGTVGDPLILMAFNLVSESDVATWQPRIIFVDEKNQRVQTK